MNKTPMMRHRRPKPQYYNDAEKAETQNSKVSGTLYIGIMYVKEIPCYKQAPQQNFK